MHPCLCFLPLLHLFWSMCLSLSVSYRTMFRVFRFCHTYVVPAINASQEDQTAADLALSRAQLFPLKKENARLLRDNNLLHLKVQCRSRRGSPHCLQSLLLVRLLLLIRRSSVARGEQQGGFSFSIWNQRQSVQHFRLMRPLVWTDWLASYVLTNPTTLYGTSIERSRPAGTQFLGTNTSPTEYRCLFFLFCIPVKPPCVFTVVRIADSCASA